VSALPSSTSIGGARAVAALLMSLDETSAAGLLKALDANVLPRVAAAMAEIESESANAPAPAPSAANAAKKSANAPDWRKLALAVDAGARATPRARDEEELGQFLERGLGAERATAVLNAMRELRRVERPFDSIESAPPSRIAKALAAESTAVRAVVLRYLSPRSAAGVLAALDPADSLRVVQRLSSAETPRRDTVELVASKLGAEIQRLAAEVEPAKPADRVRRVAEILKSAEKDVGRKVLADLDAQDKPVAEAIREMMFTWEDLATLERRAMQKVLSSVDTGKLAMALKGGPSSVEANVLANLSQRVRDMVAEERELLGPRPKAEVDAARVEMMKAVHGLVESGELSASATSEGLVS
jgi:flagellar motor switch protein FliG